MDTGEDRQIWRFPGGLRLRPHKKISLESEIRDLEPPSRLAIPLQQHIGNRAHCLVEPGQRVLKGEMLGESEGYVSAPVHASTSGHVVEIRDYPVPHASSEKAPCVIVDSDGEDQLHPDCQPIGKAENMDPGEIRQRIRRAGIVGLGGATFPTAVKLNLGPQQDIEALVLNGAECEPYISCDNALMRERAPSIITGAQILMHALVTPKCLIAVEDHMQAAVESLSQALGEADDTRIELVKVPSVYPEGGEKQLLQVLSGQEIPFDGLPVDIGYICQNVSTASATDDAFELGLPLISRIVTVTGDGIQNPCNLKVPIGTPISSLIDACGGYTDNADRVVIGGPMMGYTISNTDIPVAKGTNCVFVPAHHEVNQEYDEMPCIRCGECARVCPAKLLPQQLFWHAKAHDFDRTQAFGLFDCIECGCCAYACPSHIPLVQYYRFAKTEIWSQQRHRAQSESARKRFEARQQRLAQANNDGIDDFETMPGGPASISSDQAKSTIAEVMQRVQQSERSDPDTTDTDSN